MDDFGHDVSDDISEHTQRRSPTSPLGSPIPTRITTMKQLAAGEFKHTRTSIDEMSVRLLDHGWGTPTPKGTPHTPIPHTLHTGTPHTGSLPSSLAITIQSSGGHEFSGMGSTGMWIPDHPNLESDSVYSADLSMQSSAATDSKYHPNKSYASDTSDAYILLDRGKKLVPRKAIPQVLHSTLGLVSANHAQMSNQHTFSHTQPADSRHIIAVGSDKGHGKNGSRMDTSKLSLLQAVHFQNTGSKR